MLPVREMDRGRHSAAGRAHGLAALRSAASRSTRICLFLSVLVLPWGDSEDRSRNHPRFGKIDGVVKGVGQDRQCRLGIHKGAGRIVETASSTCDLQGQSTVALLSHEIYAIASLREFTFNRLPSWKRNMPAPAILGK